MRVLLVEDTAGLGEASRDRRTTATPWTGCKLCALLRRVSDHSLRPDSAGPDVARRPWLRLFANDPGYRNNNTGDHSDRQGSGV